jgi:hypothetical protein
VGPPAAVLILVVAVGLALGVGGHRAAAVCNDCHTPPGLLGKYTTKALNGFWRGRKLAPARDFQRKAQFYLDFVEAENSMGFHAPQEAARILAESIDFTRQGQLALREPRPR